MGLCVRFLITVACCFVSICFLACTKTEVAPTPNTNQGIPAANQNKINDGELSQAERDFLLQQADRELADYKKSIIPPQPINANTNKKDDKTYKPSNNEIWALVLITGVVAYGLSKRNVWLKKIFDHHANTVKNPFFEFMKNKKYVYSNGNIVEIDAILAKISRKDAREAFRLAAEEDPVLNRIVTGLKKSYADFAKTALPPNHSKDKVLETAISYSAAMDAIKVNIDNMLINNHHQDLITVSPTSFNTYKQEIQFKVALAEKGLGLDGLLRDINKLNEFYKGTAQNYHDDFNKRNQLRQKILSQLEKKFNTDKTISEEMKGFLLGVVEFIEYSS